MLIEKTEELVGDPMEVKLFEFAELQLNQSHEDIDVIFSFGSAYGLSGEVYKRFEFESELQRMSVIAKVHSGDAESAFTAYCKGSPEIMKEIMVAESLPSNFSTVLTNYASQGFRVLAVASRRLKGSLAEVKSLQRKEVEKQLVFDGF